MNSRRQLYRAIAIAIGSGAASVSGQARADEALLRLEEVVITATKREENLQNVPITVQALDAGTLERLDINTFDDYAKQLPSVHFAGRGPGQNEVYIRGLSTGRGSLFQSGGIGAGPSVAFYVDEAPLTAAGRNIDLYVTDMERLEVLPGPQGTLYGASSQAGTIRFITNKPDLEQWRGGGEVSLASTQDGAESWGVEGFINMPLIPNRLALRIAAYDVSNGGYIDNVHGTTSWAVNRNIGNGAGQVRPAANVVFRTADNAALVDKDINDDEYKGVRASAKLAIADGWDVTLGYMTQKLEADGVFDYSPELGDLKVQRYQPDSLKDEFDQYNWTLNGRLGMLDLIYTGSYLKRDVLQNIDLVSQTETAATYQLYYNCTYNALGQLAVCHQPDQRFRGIQHSTDLQHELRVSTDPQRTVSALGGVWYAKSHGGVSQEWAYHSPDLIPFAPNAPYSTATHFDPRTRDPEVAFFNDLVPKSEELSFFGEVTYRFTDQWSATLGARHYDIDIVPKGSYNWVTGGTVDHDDGGYLDKYKPAKEKDTIKKLTLTYKPSDTALLFATYSEGFRRGGFNRGGEVFDITTKQLAFPASYHSDTVDNYEFGWKTTFLDQTLRFNASVYYIEWSDMQIDLYDPARFGNLLFTANVGEAEVKGIEGDVSWLATSALSFQLAFSYNDTELTDRPAASDNLEPVGSELPLAPKFQGNVNARYDFVVAGLDAYAQLGVQYRDSTYTTLEVINAQDLDAYTIGDFSCGVKINDWNVKLLVSNLTNERTELFKSSQDGPVRTVTTRPRTVGLRLSHYF